jgi:uncharacterized protein (TIGR01777 family)
MRVAITGSSGLIGTALVHELSARGHEVIRIVRPSSHAKGVYWDPNTGQIQAEELEGLDAAVHLAGQSIFGTWTRGHKQRILDSRAKGTSLLATALARLARPPRVLVSASAIGYYGNRPPSESIDESASAGGGFLTDVVKVWESSATPARDAGIRVVHPRMGLVLGRHGGTLKIAAPVFYMGLGGRLGSGRQIWSWVALDDVAGSILHLIENENVSGPVNVTAPNPVTNAEFTKVLAAVVHRPAIFAVPEFVLRLAGDVANELMLSGARVTPRKLLETGYRFRYPQLQQALQAILA